MWCIVHTKDKINPGADKDYHGPVHTRLDKFASTTHHLFLHNCWFPLKITHKNCLVIFCNLWIISTHTSILTNWKWKLLHYWIILPVYKVKPFLIDQRYNLIVRRNRSIFICYFTFFNSTNDFLQRNSIIIFDLPPAWLKKS